MAALAGVAASPGLGIGTVMVIAEPCLAYEAVEVADAEAEKSRLHGAIEAFSALTREKAEVVRERVGDAEAAILEGHVLMISDPFMVAEMDNLIDAGQCAEAALDTVCETFAVMFEAADDSGPPMCATSRAACSASCSACAKWTCPACPAAPCSSPTIWCPP